MKKNKITSASAWATATILIVVIALFFGLRPKVWPLANGVTWLAEEKALRFQNCGMAYVDDVGLPVGVPDLREFTIEMVVKAETVRPRGFCPLVMLHAGDDHRQAAVWQWGRSLIVMNGRDYDYQKRLPRVAAKNVFPPGKIRYLTVTARGHRTSLYIDGQLAAEHRRWALALPEKKGQKLRLVIGNSVYGRHGWTGDLYGVAISGRAFSARTVGNRFDRWTAGEGLANLPRENPILLYAFEKQVGQHIPDRMKGGPPLELPSRVKVLKVSFLSLPGHGFAVNRSVAIDMLINIMGFVPPGFLLCGFLQAADRMGARKSALAAVGFCLTLSLGIEITQAYIPGRFSSLLDVILNTLGAGLGVIVYRLWAVGYRDQTANAL